ncbi:MAG: hypothetical protein ACRCX2_18505 [Paraclostridium sp.]
MNFSDMGFSNNYIEKQNEDIVKQRAEGFPHIWCLLNSILIEKTIEHFKSLGEAQYEGLIKRSYMKAHCIMKKIEKNSSCRKVINEYGIEEYILPVRYHIDGVLKEKSYMHNASISISFREYMMHNTTFHVCPSHFMRLQNNTHGDQKTDHIVKCMMEYGSDGSNLHQFARTPKFSRYLRAIMPVCFMPETDLVVKVEGMDDIVYPLSEIFYPLKKETPEFLDDLTERCKVLLGEKIVDCGIVGKETL